MVAFLSEIHILRMSIILHIYYGSIKSEPFKMMRILIHIIFTHPIYITLKLHGLYLLCKFKLILFVRTRLNYVVKCSIKFF